jgi:hypothetical protein
LLHGSGLRLHDACAAAGRHGACLHGSGIQVHGTSTSARRAHGITVPVSTEPAYGYTTRPWHHGAGMAARRVHDACLHGAGTVSPRLHDSTACTAAQRRRSSTAARRVHSACLHGAGVRLHNATKAARCRHGCTTRSRLHGVAVLTASRCLRPRSRRMAARRVYIVS